MARAPWEYAGPVQDAVRQFKYHRRWRIGQWLAQQMVTVVQQSLPLDQVTLVVAVPLHWVKRRFKGFNPAEHLACAVAQSIEKPYAPKAMRRTRWTRTQTRLKGRQRLRNVRGAFAANKGAVTDHTVLLVDDVLTSGATVNAAARALKDAGARRVFVLTAAHTPLATPP